MANRTQGGFVQASGPCVETWHEIANNYGTALFLGDPINLITDGTATRDSLDSTTLNYGIAVGFSYVTGGRRIDARHIPANTTFTPTAVGSINASKVKIRWATPDTFWFISVATALTEANARAAVGAGCDLTFATAGSTAYGWSGCALDSSTIGTTGKCQILELVPVAGRADANGPNELDATNWLARVRIAESVHNVATAI